CPACANVVQEITVGNVGSEKLRAKQPGARRGFFPSLRGEIPLISASLAFVALAQHADGNGCPVAFRTSERSAAEKIGVIGMSDDGQNAFAFEGESHASECRETAGACKLKIS